MNKPEQGLGMLAMAVVLCTVIVLALAGWYVVSRQSSSDNGNNDHRTSSKAKKIYTDTASFYELTIPGDWTVTVLPTGGHGPVPDPSKSSRNIDIGYPDAPRLYSNKDATWSNAIGVVVSPTADRDKTIGEVLKGATKETMNGYELLTTHPSDRYGYLDQRYVVSNGQYDVLVSFRVMQNKSAGPDANTFNDSKLLPQVEEMVHSIKLLKNGPIDWPKVESPESH